MFSDAEVDAFLALSGDSVFRASATALRSIAANEVQVLKVITNLDLKTDGKSVAEALNGLAKSLDERADDEESGEGFEIAEMITTPEQRAEHYRNEFLRTGG